MSGHGRIRQPRICGTRSAYVRGCRCHRCREANRTYVKTNRDFKRYLDSRRVTKKSSDGERH
jgi:hypothetical protein